MQSSKPVSEMDLRAYFAGQALVQFVALQGEAWSGKKLPRKMADQIAENCVELSEAMIRALS